MSIFETFRTRTRDQLFYGNITSIRNIAENNISERANVAANNPVLNPPSVLGMRYFGQSPITRFADDQIVPRPIGQFPSNDLGAGLTAYRFRNESVFQADQSIAKSFATLALGYQAMNLPGIDSVVSGGFIGSIALGVKRALSEILPSNIYSNFSELFELLTTAVSNFNSDLINTVTTLITALYSSLSSFNLSGFEETLNSIGALILGVFNKLSLPSIATLLKTFILNINSYYNNLLNSKFIEDITSDPLKYLKATINSVLDDTISGGSTIIMPVYQMTDNLNTIMNSSVFDNANLSTNKDAGIELIRKGSAIFAGIDTPIVTENSINNGYQAATEIENIINSVKNGTYNPRIPEVWDMDVVINSFGKSYSENGTINNELNRKV